VKLKKERSLDVITIIELSENPARGAFAGRYVLGGARIGFFLGFFLALSPDSFTYVHFGLSIAPKKPHTSSLIDSSLVSVCLVAPRLVGHEVETLSRFRDI
jgi:hypothetical protein